MRIFKKMNKIIEVKISPKIFAQIILIPNIANKKNNEIVEIMGLIMLKTK